MKKLEIGTKVKSELMNVIGVVVGYYDSSYTGYIIKDETGYEWHLDGIAEIKELIGE